MAKILKFPNIKKQNMYFKGAVDGVKNEIEEADKSFDEEKNQTSDTETKN